MTDLKPTLPRVRAYLAAHGWEHTHDSSDREHWRHPEYGNYPHGGILLWINDVSDVGAYDARGSGLLECLAEHENRCEHEVLADMLGIVDPATTLARIEAALDVAYRFGTTDENHHRAWVIDQMVRTLAGDGYEQWVAGVRGGEEGPESYDWDEGIIP